MDSIQRTSLTLAEASKLSHSALLSFPAATLSALFLSLLSRAGLHQQDKRSSFECIFSLSSQPQEAIASAIKFLAALNARDIRKVPAIDLSEASVINWLINSRAAVNTPVLAASFERRSPASIAARKAIGIIHKSLSSETREEAKNLLNSLIAANLIPAKVVGLFRNSLKGENLIYTNDALRSDLISYLSKFANNSDAQALINIYKSTASGRTTQERIILKQLEGENESASEAFTGSAALAMKKMSISETIAWRKEQLAREAHRAEQANDSENIAIQKTDDDISSLIRDIAKQIEQEDKQDILDALEIAETEIAELDMSVEALSWSSESDEENEDELPA